MRRYEQFIERNKERMTLNCRIQFFSDLDPNWIRIESQDAILSVDPDLAKKPAKRKKILF